MLEELATPDAALDLLTRAIAAEPSTVLRDGGVIAEGFDADLDELRGIQTNCGAFLLELEARERERTGIANLKVEFNRVHGFYIEISAANAAKGELPDDYRRRQTLKNAERFITPELKAFEDKALSAQERALAREKLLYEGVLDALPPTFRASSASPAPAPCSTACRPLPKPPPATTTPCRCSATSRASRSRPGATRWWNGRWKTSSPTTAASTRPGACC
jgi:hypothetical protein